MSRARTRWGRRGPAGGARSGRGSAGGRAGAAAGATRGVPPSRIVAGSEGLSAGGGGPADVESFLELLGRLLRLPAPQAAAIREELAGHVRDRVRDLMMAGTPEAAAVRAAVEELGDAAALAWRFRAAARAPFRRMAMNLVIVGVAGAALVTSLVAVSDGGGGRARSAVYAPSLTQPEGRGPGARAVDVSVVDRPLSEVLRLVGESVGARVAVRWAPLGEAGVDRDHPVTLAAPNADLEEFFAALSDALGMPEGDGGVQGRLRDGVLEVAPRSFFDRRESTLVRYDIGGILEAGVSEQEFTELVMQFVEPGLWQDNGGDLATMRVVAGRAFVKGPPRVHDGVAWFIEQLGGGARGGRGPGGPGGAGGGAGARAPLVPLLRDLPLVAEPFRDAGYNVFALSHVGAADAVGRLEREHPDLGVAYEVDAARNAIIVRGSAEGRGRLTGILAEIDRPEGRPGAAAAPR